MKDVLIIGFGLSGLSIAKHLEDRELTFDIISDHSQLSSKVAGGILNPIAIKRMKPVWDVESFLPYAKDYYLYFNNRFGYKYYLPKSIKVAIHTIEQENNWFDAYDKVRVRPFINKNQVLNNSNSINSNKFGVVDASGVDLKGLLQKCTEFYQANNSFKDSTFNFNRLSINDSFLKYDDESYKHIIFCEGFGIVNNPYFKSIDIYGNKGDYLIIESKNLKLEHILKAKYFLIPLGNDLYKFGATYQRSPLNHQPSSEARSQLVEALDKLVSVSYKIIDQVCGIRPTTKDRKPVLGSHPNHSNMYLLNGFGSRGVMTSPLLGKLLIENILDGKPIPIELSIDRFYA